MYWLIEDTEKIETFCRIKHTEVYVDVIPTSHNLHPLQNNICAIYLHPLNDTKGYIVATDHSEVINLPIEKIQELLDSIEKIYVRDKKDFLHYFNHKAAYQPKPTPHPYIPKLTKAHNYFYNLYTNQYGLNTIIPIVKHYEVCEENYKNFSLGEPNLFYNNKAAIVFNMIEHSSIRVDSTLYKQYFDRDTDGYIYTHYNLNTTTTRPSNAFGGINFSALNKENGERECFIPRNDVFLEMDISAYHPTLLANLLDYTFDSDDIHGDFAKMYNVTYAKAKEITFKQIYGGIWKEYENLEFFRKVKTFTDQLWDDFNYGEEITCPISGYKFKRDELENMNPQKLLNYLLQNLETANNVNILWEIFKVLRGKNTKLVLYVYDSFLFDVDRTEKDTLHEILEIFKNNKLQVKFKKGINYQLI